jgi:hypothetical protein
MTNLIFEALTWGLASGIVGAVYRGILANEETFNRWWRFGARFEGRFFFKPVWSCGHCAAGQFALWTYFLLRILPAIVDAIRLNGWLFLHSIKYFSRGGIVLFCLTIAISTAILVAKVLTYFLNKI